MRVSARLAIATLALAAVALCPAAGQVSPFHLDPARKAEADSIIATVARLPTPEARVAAYRPYYRAASEAGDVGFAVALNRGFVAAANKLPTTAETHAEVLGLLKAVDLSRFGPQGATHFEMDVTRRSAYAGNINAGERLLLRLLALPDSLLHPYTAASAHYGVAYCAYYSDRLERGARHIARAAELYEELGDDPLALQAYDGACATYFKMGRIDTAIMYGRRGLAINPAVDSSTSVNLALNYAECLSVLGRLDSARYYAQSARRFAGTLGNDGITARAEFALGNVAMIAGEHAAAQAHYRTALALFREIREVYQVASVLDSLGKAYANTTDYPDAYHMRSAAFHLRDSLREDRIRKDADTKAAELERDWMAVALETSEGERALAEALVAQRATERLALLAAGGLLLLALGFVIYRSRVRATASRELQRLVDARTAELRDRGAVLEAQTRRLSESNAELERFAYIASHDLKTPLRNITSFLGLIGRRLPAESRALVEEYLEIAIGNARHMNELISDVLEFSRLNADLDELAAPMRLSVAMSAVEQGLSAELAERGGEISVDGDVEVVLPKGALNQLLGNLVSNGLKYNQAPRPLIRVVGEDMGDRIRIAVSDNGIGIAPEYHDKIFEVFRRLHTNDEYAGTGVGLASCRKIALRLGGDIHVASAVGEGTTFTIDLPKRTGGNRTGGKRAGRAREAAPTAAQQL